MRAPPKWVSKQAVLAIHERLLAEHGGALGLLDHTQNHPFADGNKRVAPTVAGVFMELNGFRLEASEQDAAQATRALSSREIDEAEFARWLRTCSSKLRAAPRRKPLKVKSRRQKGTKKR